jgi:hypothetical protein
VRRAGLDHDLGPGHGYELPVADLEGQRAFDDAERLGLVRVEVLRRHEAVGLHPHLDLDQLAAGLV